MTKIDFPFDGDKTNRKNSSLSKIEKKKTGKMMWKILMNIIINKFNKKMN